MKCETGRNIALEIHNGNRDAVSELVDTYQDRLYTYAFHMLGGSDDAREVTQDAFVKAYFTLTGRYDAARCQQLEIRPWLYRILRNMALNRLRSRKRKRAVLDSLKENAGVFEPRNDQARAVRKALEQLGRESRELIILRFIEGSSYAQITAITGQTESALRGKVYRALRKLRKIMEEDACGL